MMNKMERIEFEVVGTDNPLILNLATLGTIISCELEQFNYVPTTNPNIQYMAVDVNGVKGKYNSLGLGLSSVKTIPYNPTSQSYSFKEESDDNSLKLTNNECNLIVSFVARTADKATGLNKTKFVFDNNYLFNFSLLVQKH